MRTPLPIYVEYAGTEKVVKVMARYKAIGMTEWKPIELKKVGENGWGANVQCMDVQIGRIGYFLQGFNEANDPIAAAGDRKHPFIVPIKQAIDSEPPHLPGQPALAQCADTGDCPPDFPGCKSGVGGAGPDDSLKKAGGVDCDEDSECRSNKCSKNRCADEEGHEKKAEFPRIWLGANLSLDFDFVPSAQDVCALDQKTALPVNSSNYFCYNANESRDYPSRKSADENNRIVLGRNDRVDGGTAIGQFRALLSFDYAITKNILAGARVGVAVPGFPGAAPSDAGVRSALTFLHVEARGTFVFGGEGIKKVGIAPYAMAHLGMSSFETAVPVKVNLDNNTAQDNVNAWKIGGPFFFGLGGGVRYALSPKAALFGGLRLDFGFDATGVMPILAPELGGQIGF